MLDYYPDRSSPVLEVKGQGHLGQKNTSRCQDPPSLHTNGMRWLQAAGSTSVTQQWMSAFPGGRGVTACSDARSGFGVTHVVRRAFRTGGGSVWWDLCIASLLMHLFLCCLFSVSFAGQILTFMSVSYTHLTLPTIYSV